MDLRSAHAVFVREMLAREGVEATYTPQGSEDSYPVMVHVTSVAEVLRRFGPVPGFGGGSHRTPGSGGAGGGWAIMAPAIQEGEVIADVGSGVGEDGGVPLAQRGDRFTVPGHTIGSAAASVDLLVTGRGHLVHPPGSHWIAGVAP